MSRSVYDPASTGILPLRWTYQALNLLHVNTSPSFIRREILFAEGDCYDPFLISESARLLDQHGFLNVEEFEAEPDGQGGHRVRVATRDEWSTQVDVGATYDAGLNIERFQATEENLLGRGVRAEFTHYARRETRIQSFGVRTPRFFGRADAGLAAGTDRPGSFFNQYLRYPFVGEASRLAGRQAVERGTDFFAYATDASAPFTQVLVPVFREHVELSGAYRFGEPGASVILGASLTRDLVTFPRVPEVTFGDFDLREPLPGAQPAEMQRQLRPFSATRLAVHLGTARRHYVEYRGVDGVRERRVVALGLFAGATVGRSIPLLTPEGAPEDEAFFARGHFSFTHPLGPVLLHGGATAETRDGEGGWGDLIADVDLVGYLRRGGFRWEDHRETGLWDLSSHTLFWRVSSAGGWHTTLPFQINLGGREGVRSLPEDRYPGGRMLRFVVEDRIALPWPRRTADLGLTLFSDIGRVWAGDVPYGVDSGWRTALGVGLRLGLPHESRHIYRTDLAFPLGGGDPIFRVTFELNRLAAGFYTRESSRSRRFTLGPESF